MMTTDLERLQKVRSGKLTGRGVGKTYASCYSALEFIRDNPDGVVFWFLPKWNWIHHIQSIFSNLFEEFNFTQVRRSQFNIKIGDARIIFKVIRTDTPWHAEEDVRESVRGYRKLQIIYDSIYSYQGDN